MITVDITSVKWDDKGLVPAVIQDVQTKKVLMLAYMNKESLEKTIETKETWFFSRSRQELWHKGATSGNVQQVLDIKADCDNDTLLVLVKQKGVACHTGTYTCFGDKEGSRPSYEIINLLIEIIAQRDIKRPEGSYTTYLFEQGLDKILKKVGEETSEVIIAAKNLDNKELTYEISDLIYHLLVLMQNRQLAVNDVLAELTKRHSDNES